MKLLNKYTQRCEHRHKINTHPHCFNSDGMPKYLAGEAPKLPKVLIFDVETSPLKAFVWQTQVWNARVSEGQVLSEWFMLTWSAKWLLDDNVMSAGLTSKEAKEENDERIVKELWKLLDEADIVIAHNGDRFDVPNMNTRFIVNNLPPTSPYQSIDTVRVARRQFGFTHNNLNALARVFGFDAKLDTDFDLWKRCVDGDKDALIEMETYNKQDVQLLEEVYLKLRPWIKAHPNLGLYVESTEPVCPNCGSKEIKWTGKNYYTQTGKYATYKCDCGAFGRARQSTVPKEVKKNLGVSVAR